MRKFCYLILTMKLSLLIFYPLVLCVEQVPLRLCYQCHRVIISPSFGAEIMRKCLYIFEYGHCGVYWIVRSDTSIYFWSSQKKKALRNIAQHLRNKIFHSFVCFYSRSKPILNSSNQLHQILYIEPGRSYLLYDDQKYYQIRTVESRPTTQVETKSEL